MSDLLPINAEIKAEVKADLTHTVDTMADMSHETHKGIGKFLNACLGPWIEQRNRTARLIAAQTERDSQDILTGRKSLTEIIGNVSSNTEVSTLDALCNELVQSDSTCKAKRLMSALLTAAAEIKQIPEDEISDEPLNQTFFNHWRAEAELIDDEDLRQLWAKLLVEETRKTNSVSPRTLGVVKNLSKQDAVIFERLGKCFVGNAVIVNSKDHPLNGDYDDVLLLQDAGLIGQLSSRWFSASKNNLTIIPLPNVKFLLVAPCAKITFRCHILTPAGLQLFKFITKSNDIQYSFAKCL